MGNASGKSKLRRKSVTVGIATSAELSQPGQPKVRLSSFRKSAESSEVSDEVVLHWKPCSSQDKGYEIEMWDLGLQEWVHVATTQEAECTLSNILSGILYRFRVMALTSEGGVSFPSDPSEPFVIDIPGVQIAPYWIQTPPTIISLTVNQRLQLTAAALGTPAPNFHWYKDDEELFIRHNLAIESTSEGSTLTIMYAESDDGGVYSCSAVNTVGKCTWETTVDLKAKPAFTLPTSLKKAVAFQIDELMTLKVPLIAVPEPALTFEKVDCCSDLEATYRDVRLLYRDNFAIIKIESAQKCHSGHWRLTATNPIGSAEVGLHIVVRSEPNPPKEAPEVVEVQEEGIVRLSWQCNPEDADIYDDIQYQVEYNRESWDIWLKGCVTRQTTCSLMDLFPGSYYRFRIKSVSKNGISQPSAPSERVFIGRPLEDELFGLPGGNYPKERSTNKNLFHFGPGIRHSKKYASLGQDLPQFIEEKPKLNNAASEEGHLPTKPRKDRQFSLERDVYYFGNNQRKEVVTYEANAGKKLGSNAAAQFGLSEAEQAVYRSSLGDLCNKLMRASQTKLAAAKPERNTTSSTLSIDKVFSRMDQKNNTWTSVTSTEDEKALLVSSLTQLCFRLKSVSRENSLAPQSKSPHHSNSSLSMMRQKYPESYPPMSLTSRSSSTNAMSKDEAKKALTASCERIASMQNLVMSSTEALATLAKIDQPDEIQAVRGPKLDNPSVAFEPPLLTSSPAFSTFRKQPNQLRVAHDFVEEEEETAEENEAKERQAKQRQNLLLSTSYFVNQKKPSTTPICNDFKPTLTPISSRTVTPTAMGLPPKSQNLSTSSKTSLASVLNSEATMKGHPSIEMDSSKTLLGSGHNDTFDNSEMSDFSYD